MKFGIFSVVDHYPNELPRTSGRLYAIAIALCVWLLFEFAASRPPTLLPTD